MADGKRFTAEERAAMKERARELKTAATEEDVLAKSKVEIQPPKEEEDEK